MCCSASSSQEVWSSGSGGGGGGLDSVLGGHLYHDGESHGHEEIPGELELNQTAVTDLVPISVQKINHFPGMGEICRKDLLGRNLTRMKKLFPKEYNIFPRTWVMPAE